MKKFISCGTCKHRLDNPNRNPKKCSSCVAEWAECGELPNWEDALPCCKNKGVEHR